MNNQLILTERLQNLFAFATEHNASDLHVNVGISPVIRIDGRLRSIPGQPVYTAETAKEDVLSTLNEQQRQKLLEHKDIDFSFTVGTVHLRANVFYEQKRLAGSYRLIPTKIKTIDDLGLPPILTEFTGHKQGFIIITGPAGHGKSTTLAAMIDHINKTRSENIITIEDPVEYIFAKEKSIISQREIDNDATTFSSALTSILRQDPNVILVGEMRDLETIKAALTLAETGHLVFTSLHTNSAAQTADRIIDVFPPHQQQQVRSQLANTLLGIISQRLIPKINGGRMVAAEVLVATNAVRNMIREGRTHQIDNVVQTGAAEGMISLDNALAHLVNKGEITIDEALVWSNNPNQLKMSIY